MPTAPGLLVIWNRIAPEHDAEFNAWYEAEHLAERLSVPGFRTARRYRAVADRHAYSAIYETDTPGVLATPRYRALLANPTPRTRAIMPFFLDVTRGACCVASDSEPGARAYRHMALAATGAATPAASAMPHAPAGARLRLIVPDPDATGGATPEQAIRPRPDRLPPAFVIAEAGDEAALETALAAIRGIVAAEPPRRFVLIGARSTGQDGTVTTELAP